MKPVMFVAMLAAATATADAQNLVRNPSFDTDAAGWELSTYATWSDIVDHDNSPLSGALQVTTRDTDFGRQCIAVNGATRYAISLWVEKDPQPSIAPCASPNHFIQIELHDVAQCADPATMELDSAERNPEPDGWQHFQDILTVDATTQSIMLTLSGKCSTLGSGISIHYFDDVSVEADEILHADFEITSPPPSA